MNRGLCEITRTVEENTNGISGVAEDVTVLVEAIATIKEESDNNQDIAGALGQEVNRFKKV